MVKMKSSRRLNIITHDIKIHTANFIIYNLRKINSKIAKIINSMSKNNDDLSNIMERYNIKLIKFSHENLIPILPKYKKNFINKKLFSETIEILNSLNSFITILENENSLFYSKNNLYKKECNKKLIIILEEIHNIYIKDLNILKSFYINNDKVEELEEDILEIFKNIKSFYNSNLFNF